MKFTQTSLQVPITFNHRWQEDLQTRVALNGPWDQFTMWELAREAASVTQIHKFDDLLSLRQLPELIPFPHQIDTVKRVLHEQRGRAILADEVGLGKTIEAGLICKEYWLRGLASRVLILVPASLVLQWTRELNQKIKLPAVAQKKAHNWSQAIVVASMDTAKREPHCQQIFDTAYDLVIVDEAHKLKNPKTANYQFMQKVRSTYCLLLTATPMQNEMKELYHLISLLQPGQLGQASQFRTDFVQSKRSPKNELMLKEQLAQVMIRNTHQSSKVELPPRQVKNILLELSVPERALYQDVERFVRQRLSADGQPVEGTLTLLTLQREVCSSRDAVFLSLVRLIEKMPKNAPERRDVWGLIEHLRQVQQSTKSRITIDLIQQLNEKVVVFTEYRATQEHLLHELKQAGIIAVAYRGGMPRGKKDWMQEMFRRNAQVMIATEAGGEGINLQFCHNIINYDLPWNPMRVEQRIGRLHRLGQLETVRIYNLAVKGTVEEHILHLLHEKIKMFEAVVGEMDDILQRWEQVGMEHKLLETLARISDPEQVEQQLSEIHHELHQPVGVST